MITMSTVEEVAALEKKSGGASLHTGETDAAAETTPTASDSKDNITSPDKKVNPASTKNPENSQREMEILNMVIESGDMSGAALIADNWHVAKAKKVT